MSGTPPHDEERARWDRNLEHVRAIRAALEAHDFTELTTATQADLDAAEATERRRYTDALRRAVAADRAAQEADRADRAAQALEEAVDLAEVIELRPTAEEHGK